MDHHSRANSSRHSTAYQSFSHVATPPSRIPRPSSSSTVAKNTPTSASYARTSSPARTNSTHSRKRPRPTSVAEPLDLSHHGARTSLYSSPYVVSPPPSDSYFTTPQVSKYGDRRPSMASITGRESPSLVNTRYTLAGGMDTPGIAADRHYERMETETGPLDGRFGRAKLAAHVSSNDTPSFHDTSDAILSGERNGFGRGAPHQSHPQSLIQPHTNTWGGFLTNLVSGAWSLCKSTAFAGFSAGGGQPYSLPQNHTNSFASESMWEDDLSTTRSWDRLPTPVPGEYPGDTPSEDEQEKQGCRGSKRLHTGDGEWIVVERDRARSPRISTPISALSLGQARVPSRQSHGRSGSTRRHKIPSGTRHRMSSVSYGGSPVPMQGYDDRIVNENRQYPQIHSKRHSLHAQRSPPRFSAPTFDAKPTFSPPSVEAKKFAARIRRDERVADEKFEKLNDKLKEMIRQGKEALGSKVEIVDEDGDEEMW